MGVLGLWSIIEHAGTHRESVNGSGSGSGSGTVQPEGDSHAGAATTTVVNMRLAEQMSVEQHEEEERRKRVASSAAAASSSSSSAIAQPLPIRPLPLCLRDRVFAVDLSVWLMEASSVAQSWMTPSASSPPTLAAGAASALLPHKPHLLYLLNRVSAFLRNNISLVFVMDGRAPTIKARLLSKDNKVGSVAIGVSEHEKLTQMHRRKQHPSFIKQMDECATMLALMDIPVLRLVKGEAEALCAALNARGAVDGVITPDVDAFLFGARRVIKDIQASQLKMQAKVIEAERIKHSMGLDRSKLVLLALLLGSDYTSGVRSLGPRKAVKFLDVLDRCVESFEAEAPISAAAAADSNGPHAAYGRPQKEDSIIRLFRTLLQAATPESAMEIIFRHYRHTDGSMLLSPPSPTPVSSSPRSPDLIDLTSMSAAELKVEMAKFGLKARGKAEMIEKLTVIYSKSPSPTIAAGIASPPPSASAADEIMVLSDEDNEEEDAAVTSRKKPSKQARPSKSKKDKTNANTKKLQVSLRQFLTTYFTKIHQRYHSSMPEVELLIESYLKPTLEPSVEVMEKRLHRRVPSPDFVRLRSFCSTSMGMSSTKFEKHWVPVQLHLELWRMERARRVEEESRRAMEMLEDLAEFGDDDDPAFRPPITKTSSSIAQLGSNSSSASGFVSTSAPLTLAASARARNNSATSTSTRPVTLYTPDRITKRRIIQGQPYFVLEWHKTDEGRKLIATLPIHMQTAHSTQIDTDQPQPAISSSQESEENGGEDDAEDEIDLTNLAQPFTSSPSIQPVTVDARKPKASRKLLIQEVDVDRWETNESAAFLRVAMPELVHAFEEREKKAAQEKEAERREKAKARGNKGKGGGDGMSGGGGVGSGPGASKRGIRGRRAGLASSFPSILSFLDPSPPLTLARCRRELHSPPPSSTPDHEQQRVDEADAAIDSAVHEDEIDLTKSRMGERCTDDAQHARSSPTASASARHSSLQQSLITFHTSKSLAQSKLAASAPGLFAALASQETERGAANVSSSLSSSSSSIFAQAAAKANSGVRARMERSVSARISSSSSITAASAGSKISPPKIQASMHSFFKATKLPLLPRMQLQWQFPRLNFPRRLLLSTVVSTPMSMSKAVSALFARAPSRWANWMHMRTHA